MSKKQIRFGTGPTDKARMTTITRQQIDEICAVTGESLAECVQMAIAQRHVDIVYHAQRGRIKELESHILKLEAALVEAANK